MRASRIGHLYRTKGSFRFILIRTNAAMAATTAVTMLNMVGGILMTSTAADMMSMWLRYIPVEYSARFLLSLSMFIFMNRMNIAGQAAAGDRRLSKPPPGPNLVKFA